ncbi:MAG: hypothetical protein V7K50_12745 [Nostoc sp.]
MIQTSSEFLFFVLPLLVSPKGQTVMQIMCQNIIGCGSQGLQSANEANENKSAWTRQGSYSARDTANLQ